MINGENSHLKIKKMYSLGVGEKAQWIGHVPCIWPAQI